MLIILPVFALLSHVHFYLFYDRCCSSIQITFIKTKNILYRNWNNPASTLVLRFSQLANDNYVNMVSKLLHHFMNATYKEFNYIHKKHTNKRRMS